MTSHHNPERRIDQTRTKTARARTLQRRQRRALKNTPKPK